MLQVNILGVAVVDTTVTVLVSDAIVVVVVITVIIVDTSNVTAACVVHTCMDTLVTG